MPHPHWSISPSGFVEKTTKAKDGCTVSEANIVLKTFYQLRCTISSVCILRWRMRFPEAFHTAAKKCWGGGGGVKKERPNLHPLCYAPVRLGFLELKMAVISANKVPARSEENIDLLYRP